jgi:hypothetical protein
MKRRILLVICSVVVLIGMLAAGVSASTVHQPVQGTKLIGIGNLGTFSYSFPTMPVGQPTRYDSTSTFNFTNTDCVKRILITRVSVISDNGTVVYEGPFYTVVTAPNSPPEKVIVTRPMEPHETWGLLLAAYMYDSTGRWLSIGEASALPTRQYTVEITWVSETKGTALPPTGLRSTINKDIIAAHTRDNSSDNDIYVQRFVTESPMVNLTQLTR